MVLDVGTEAVKSLILEKDKDELSVLGVGIQYFEKYSSFKASNFEAEVIKKAILSSVRSAHNSLESKIKDWKKLPILLGLSPDILKARVVWQSHNRLREVKVSQEEEKNILQRIIRRAKENIVSKFSEESGILPRDIQWISLRILEIEVNGYPISSIYGCREKDLRFKVLAIFSLKHYLRDMEKIFKDLKLKVFKIEHLAGNLANKLGNDNILLDIGGKTTQIFLMKKGILEKVSEFASGGESFSYKLSQELGIDENSARDLKEKYANNLLTENVRAKIARILSSEKNLWYQSLQDKARLMNIRNISLNNKLFGGSSLLPEIKELLPTARIIQPKDLKDIKDKTKSLNSPQFIPSLLIAHHAKEIF